MSAPGSKPCSPHTWCRQSSRPSRSFRSHRMARSIERHFQPPRPSRRSRITLPRATRRRRSLLLHSQNCSASSTWASRTTSSNWEETRFSQFDLRQSWKAFLASCWNVVAFSRTGRPLRSPRRRQPLAQFTVCTRLIGGGRCRSPLRSVGCGSCTSTIRSAPSTTPAQHTG